MTPEDKKYFTVLSDWQLLGFNIEREAGGEPRDGKIAVGTVTLERVDHRDWDGKTIQEVILKRSQFTWTMPEYGKEYYDDSVEMARNFQREYEHNETLRECCAIARGLLQGEIPRDPDLAAVHCCQYLNPKEAAAARAKWLKSGMRIIKKIGHHEFFME